MWACGGGERRVYPSGVTRLLLKPIFSEKFSACGGLKTLGGGGGSRENAVCEGSFSFKKMVISYKNMIAQKSDIYQENKFEKTKYFLLANHIWFKRIRSINFFPCYNLRIFTNISNMVH